MRTAPEQPSARLIERLLAEPQRFGFFQAVRLLLCWLGEQGVPPRRALERHLRFRNSLALGFPAGEIESIVQQRSADDAPPRFVLTPTFMGLLGAHGALPAHVTERIAAFEAQPDDPMLAGAPRAFLDLFSMRMPGLLYGAWRKYRVEHAVADGGDAFMPLLLALAGLGSGAGHPAVDDAALARYAGVLRQRPASAMVLARVLADHFGTGFTLEEGIGFWDVLAPGERARLGGAVLGQAALLGERCWRPDLRVRVRIGPLRRPAFERFLPHAEGASALRTLLGLFAAPTLVYEVVLVLARSELRPLRLGALPQRLGRDSYLLCAPAAADRADMVYTLRPLAPLAPPRTGLPPGVLVDGS